MTTRDYFAAAAMQVLIEGFTRRDVLYCTSEAASNAYDIADAMMQERARRNGNHEPDNVDALKTV